MELKKYKDCKFIVSSGCSYGMIPKAVIKPFNLINRTSDFNRMDMELYKQYGKNWLEIDEDIIVMNVSLGSQGSDWQSDSTIHICQKLLECGVKNENIYVLVEWSQWRRFSVHPFHYVNLDLNKFDWSGVHNFFFEYVKKGDLLFQNKDLSDKIFNDLEITTSTSMYSIGKIKDRIYISPSHVGNEGFKSLGTDYDYLIKTSQNLDDSFPLENKIKTYLNNILRTQYYLKTMNIKYNFLFMQSTLSNWKKDENGLVSHELVSPFESNFNPINDSNTDMEVVLPETKLEIDQIDFTQFWLYENEKYRRGGIDDWTIDNFKEVSYINLHKDAEEHLSKWDMKFEYGAHPNTIPYLLLWNKISKNCDFLKVRSDFENFMLEKYWEDYNYGGFSKNNITISKNEWLKRINS
jgi:hypothetical protein